MKQVQFGFVASAMLTLVFALSFGSQVYAEDPAGWFNPELNSECREASRAPAMPLADAEAALTDAIEPKTPYVKSLDGVWKVWWVGRPDLRPLDFWKPDFDDADWPTVDVPSCLELRGFGFPLYTNSEYPHPATPPFPGTNFNPVASYRTDFTVPAEWADRDVKIRFEGVYSAFTLWVNGQKVGYAEGSKLPSEFDVTKYLNGVTNSLAVEVIRWSGGSFLEDQDMFRFTGIYRRVSLVAMPKKLIRDFVVKTVPLDADYVSWRLDVTAEGEDVKGALFDEKSRKVGDLVRGDDGTLSLTFDAITWNAEHPYLYTLVLKNGEDIRSSRVGFVQVKIDGNVFKVNGRAVKLRGVNRHEHSVDNGRSVSMEDMLADIRLLKRYNFNTVRTSHYPDDPRWYELCDRYGIYLVAEANVEGHGMQYGDKGLGLFKEWEQTIVERNVNHVKNYRNHPSIVMWSLGNETGHGPCFVAARDAIRAMDARPIHWERGNDIADVDSKMYPSVEWLETRGKLGDGALEEMKDIETTQHRGKCFFLCEYAHAMGNAMGNFKEYWDVFYAHPSLSGGCVWDWVDQALWKYTGRVNADGTPERYLAYGGDFDDYPNFGCFCCNGIIRPDRSVSAKLIEAGHVLRGLAVVANGEAGLLSGLSLENRYSFTSADEFDGRWTLVEDGRNVASGSFAVPKVAPLSREVFLVPDEFKTALAKRMMADALPHERFANFAFALKADTLWAPKGFVLAADQIALDNNISVHFAAKPAAEGAKATYAEDDKTVTVKAGGTEASFCRRSGTLCKLTMEGKSILASLPDTGAISRPELVTGPILTFVRAFVDNDDEWGRWMWRPFYEAGAAQASYHPARLEVSETNGTVTVKSVTRVTTIKSAGFEHTAVWTFLPSGRIEVANREVPFGAMPELPRLGVTIKLDKSLGNVSWYGRGPRENYRDRKSGSFVGLWLDTVDGLWEDYVRPQDNGFRSDVRYVTLSDADGRGVKFSFQIPGYFQAMRYSWEDVEFARNRRGQFRFRSPLVPRDEIYLNLDCDQTGLGGASCGPIPEKCYIIDKNAIHEWTYAIEAVR